MNIRINMEKKRWSRSGYKYNPTASLPAILVWTNINPWFHIFLFLPQIFTESILVHYSYSLRYIIIACIRRTTPSCAKPFSSIVGVVKKGKISETAERLEIVNTFEKKMQKTDGSQNRNMSRVGDAWTRRFKLSMQVSKLVWQLNGIAVRLRLGWMDPGRSHV